ncbi:MAG: electron transport complex subunit RsxC [Oscillospiraceae bacterium]
MGKLNSIRLKHNKNTQNDQTVQFPLPKTVTISMSQNMGAPANPLVNVGDEVFVGQKIGDTDAYISTPIHSSVSGKVLEINDLLLANGKTAKSVLIEADGKQTVSDEVKIPKISNKAEFIAAVRASGACGLGGAGFPTHVKFAFDAEKTPIDTLVINAAECEPYITSDYRELIEHSDDVLGGICLLIKYLDIKLAKVCIENNKPEAIKLLTKITENNDQIEVVTLKSEYPQGAEKMIVYSATGRIIGEGELPSDCGVMVMNVSTTSFICKYFRTGMPLISRRLTIDGNALKKPCNVEVLLGTKISEVLDYVGAEGFEKLLSGGPMMGTCLYDTSAPIVKTHNALLVLKNIPISQQTACIRCGMCIKVCPMNLMPTELEKAYDSRNIEALKALKVGLCMNCGSCSYVCPAARPLAEKNQLAKSIIPRN